MNIPNKITILRVLLTPIFVACILYYTPEHDYLRFAALVIFVIAMFSDALDGYIARRWKQLTILGAYIDPIADKLLLVSAFICLSVVKNFPIEYRLPAWLPILIISRDIIILLGAIVIHLLTQNLHVRPSIAGKLTTFFQMITIVCVLIQCPYARIVWFVTASLTVVSGIGYIRRGSKLLEAANVWHS